MILSQWIMVRAASCASPFRVLKITGGKHFSGFDACDTTDCFVVEPTDWTGKSAGGGMEGGRQRFRRPRLRSFGIRYSAPYHPFVGRQIKRRP